MAAALRRGVTPTERARRHVIEGAVERAAQSGLDAGPDVASAAFDDLGRVAPISPTRALELATAHLTGERAVGGVRLSARLHATQEATVAAMAGELHQTMHAGLSVERAAQRLLEVDDAVVELPAYIRRIRDAVRLGDQVRLHAVIDAHVAQVEGLSDPTLRAAGREFIRRARTATEQDLDRQIAYWVRDRALYSERVVVRTEAARVHAAAFVESTKDQPWVKGYRWELSPSHPKPDVCDLYANQAIDGLGPGGYLPENLPQLPAHPSCLCFTTAIIDDQHYERELAALQGTDAPPDAWSSSEHETASGWLGRQPEGFQRNVLGPGRLAVFRVDPERVIGPRGRIAPLWQALGDSPPPRRLGVERVRVAGVDPFREAGSRTPREPPPPPPRPPRKRRARAAPPPPPPVQTPAAAARDRMGAALARRSGFAAPARAASRSWIGEVYGSELRSHDADRPYRDELVVGSLGRYTRGSHDWRGRIRIATPVMNAARAGFRALRGRTRGELLEPEQQAIRTILHEEMHGHSACMPGAYARAGKVLEEALVELHARELTERLLELQAGSTVGSYEYYIEDVRAAVRDAFPGAADIDERIRRAGRSAWSGGPIETPGAYVDRFHEALGAAADRQSALRGALHNLRPRT